MGKSFESKTSMNESFNQENDIVTDQIKERILQNEGHIPMSWLHKFKEHTFQKIFKNKKSIDDFDVKTVLFAFLNRRRFDYTPSMLFTYFMKCFCLRNVKKFKYLKDYSDHYLFEKAEQKFRNELDVVRIVKTLRRYKMFAQAMLS